MMVLNPKDVDLFKKQFEELRLEHGLCFLRELYHDEKIVLFHFVCNGNGPWYLGYVHLPYLFWQQCGYYSRITEKRTKKGVIETHIRLSTYIKKMISEESFDKIFEYTHKNMIYW